MGNGGSIEVSLAVEDFSEATGGKITRKVFDSYKDASGTISRNTLLEIIEMKYDVYLTYHHSVDDLNQNNYERVLKLARGLGAYNFTPTHTEEKSLITGDIIHRIRADIDRSQCILFCLTKKYIECIRRRSPNDRNYNEFMYIREVKNKSFVIPIFMEPGIDLKKLDTSFSNVFTVREPVDFFRVENFDNFMFQIDQIIRKIVVPIREWDGSGSYSNEQATVFRQYLSYPNGKVIRSSSSTRISKRSSAVAPEDSFFTLNPVTSTSDPDFKLQPSRSRDSSLIMKRSSSSTLLDRKMSYQKDLLADNVLISKPLLLLSVDEILKLFKSMDILDCDDLIKENQVTGELLYQIQNVDEFFKLGFEKTNSISTIQIKKLFQLMDSFKKDGVPMSIINPPALSQPMVRKGSSASVSTSLLTEKLLKGLGDDSILPRPQSLQSLSRIQVPAVTHQQARRASMTGSPRFLGASMYHSVGHENAIKCMIMVLSGGHDVILTGGADTLIKKWSINQATHTLECIRVFQGHQEPVTCLAVSTDNEKDELVSGSLDGTIKVWNILRGDCLKTIKLEQNSVSCLWFWGAGQILSGGSDNLLRLWSVYQGDVLRSLSGAKGGISCMVRLDADRVAVGDTDSESNIRIYNISSFSLIMTLSGHSDVIRQIVVGLLGEMISVSKDGTMKIWQKLGDSYVNSHIVRHPPTEDGLWSVVVMPDGSYATGSSDGIIRIWSLLNGFSSAITEITGHSGCVNSLEVDSLGQLVSVSEDGTIQVWH